MPVKVPYVLDIDVTPGRVDVVAPGIRRVVAANPGKFTFTGTGTYLIGEGDVAVVDAGPRDPAHVDALVAALAGERVTHLLVTHTHGDHSPASALLRERLGVAVPTVGFGPHPLTADAERAWNEANPIPDDLGRVEGADERAGDDVDETGAPRLEERADHEFVPDIALTHGDELSCAGYRVEALHTPGHISNHLCYAVPELGVLFTGDHVMGWSTTIVPPPDGDMRAYLRSLEVLLARDDRTYWPTHGPAITEPRRYVEALLAHRREREAGILEQLAHGPRTIPELVVVLYADVRPELHKPAARSVMAQLIALVDEGRVVASTGGATMAATYEVAS